MTRILVVDNYDSFVYTLNGYVQQLGAETDVVRNDAFPESEIADRIAEYDGVLLSPGSGYPSGRRRLDPHGARGHRLPKPRCWVSASGTRPSLRPSARP